MSSRLDIQLGRIQGYFDSSAGEVFLPDLCDLIEPGTISDGLGGQTLDDDVISFDVPCRVDEITGGGDEDRLGGTTVVMGHEITVPQSDEALSLTINGKIRVHARGDIAERIFERPIRSEDSLIALTEFRATLIAAGYRQGLS